MKKKYSWSWVANRVIAYESGVRKDDVILIHLHPQSVKKFGTDFVQQFTCLALAININLSNWVWAYLIKSSQFLVSTK